MVPGMSDTSTRLRSRFKSRSAKQVKAGVN